MAGLFPVFELPAQLASRANAPAASAARRWPTNPLFDMALPDVVTDAEGRCLFATARESWEQETVRMAMTQRGAFAGHSREYGVDWQRCLEQPTAGAMETMITRELRRALARNPRTREVGPFAFTRSTTALTVQFTVTPVDGAPLTVTLARGA